MTSVSVTRPVHRAPRRTVRAHPNAVLTAIGVGAVGVLVLWWIDTPYVAGLGDWLTNAGRITGLLAGYGIAVLVALMARIPAVDRGVGSDRLVRWHAMGGRYVVCTSVAHTLLTIWGYAVTEATGVVRETVRLNLSYPDVWKATVAVVLLVGIGIISARAVRPRMRYETWYHLHFCTYLAAYLAFGHQLATGQEFMGNKPLQAAWYALYVGVAVLLAWYRVLVPVRNLFRHRLTVTRIAEEGRGVISIYLTGRRLHRLEAEPGQFFRWRFLTRDLWWAANPYSLSAQPRRDVLRITVKGLGDQSRALRRIRPGTRVLAEGPYGAFTAARRRHRKVLLIAGGVGITPVRALFESLPAGPGDLTLLYRAHRTEDLVFRGELEAIAAGRGARLHYVVGDRRRIGDPFTAPVLLSAIPDLRYHDVYLCGPPGMRDSAIGELRRAGVRRGRIHHESFEF